MKGSKLYVLALTAGLVLGTLPSAAAQREWVFTEASELTIVGKLMPGRTANPYHRVDTTLYKGFTEKENQFVRESSGMACVFRTDSKAISVLTKYGFYNRATNTNQISGRGYDLYIKKDGEWVFAGAGVRPENSLDEPLVLVYGLDGEMHDCLLYFPTYSEELSIKVGVDVDAVMMPIENPFRHRVAIWGSSFTHGSCTTRAGMAYPAQFSRNTGIQMLSLGCSGRCLLQDYFCDVLCDVEADAFVFDAFSNPSAEMIQERLVPFIDRMIAAHPGVPMIFQQTIYREGRNFNSAINDKESRKMEIAAQILKDIKSTKEGKAKYKDVYFIHPDTAVPGYYPTVDGVHPDNYGYTVWAKSIEKPILKILAKYSLK